MPANVPEANDEQGRQPVPAAGKQLATQTQALVPAALIGPLTFALPIGVGYITLKIVFPASSPIASLSLPWPLWFFNALILISPGVIGFVAGQVIRIDGSAALIKWLSVTAVLSVLCAVLVAWLS